MPGGPGGGEAPPRVCQGYLGVERPLPEYARGTGRWRGTSQSMPGGPGGGEAPPRVHTRKDANARGMEVGSWWGEETSISKSRARSRQGDAQVLLQALGATWARRSSNLRSFQACNLQHPLTTARTPTQHQGSGYCANSSNCTSTTTAYVPSLP
eukprot:361182-Chlamydomonas_euryale.AAC.7